MATASSYSIHCGRYQSNQHIRHCFVLSCSCLVFVLLFCENTIRCAIWHSVFKIVPYFRQLQYYSASLLEILSSALFAYFNPISNNSNFCFADHNTCNYLFKLQNLFVIFPQDHSAVHGSVTLVALLSGTASSLILKTVTNSTAVWTSVGKPKDFTVWTVPQTWCSTRQLVTATGIITFQSA